MNGGLRVRVVGLGGWGTRAAEFFAAQGVPAHAVDLDIRVMRAAVPESVRHHLRVPGGAAGDYAAAARALASDEGLRRALGPSDDDLILVLGHLGFGAGMLVGAMLQLAAEATPRSGRLAVGRLSGIQSAPDDRAFGLVALNAVLEAPDAGILLVQPSQGMGTSAEAEAKEALERVVGLLRLLAVDDQAVAGLSPAALLAHLSTPGFVGWREVEVSAEMCMEDAPGWMESLSARGTAWQPEGFAWQDAQAVLPIARLPREWIEAGGRAQFDRFVQQAWSEAAPCAITRSLQVGEPAVAIVVSAGLSYPEGLLELRDSVQADRERLAEKRRAAATPIPLGDDFLPRGATLRAGDTFAMPGQAPVPPAAAPHDRRPESPDERDSARISAPTYRPEPLAPSTGREEAPRPAPKPRHETYGAGVAGLSHERFVGEPGYGPAEEEHAFDEVRTVAATATEAESEAKPIVPEMAAPVEALTTEEAPTAQEAPPIREAPIGMEQPAESGPALTGPPVARAAGPASAPAAREPEKAPAPRIAEAPSVSPYKAGLSLAWRVLNARDPAVDVDLGEIRYALYDLLEVIRENPSSILAEVFRRTESDYFERHHVNVAVLSILTADQLGATLSDIIDLGTAAMLHDIGMSDSRDAWDADVRLAPKVFDTTIRQHPERGHSLLRKIPGMTADIARIVREEHERLDGTGYPEGLSGDAIDPGARIVAVCDTLEALTHPRPYRERLTLGEALSRLQILGQYTLDMAVVQTLTDALTAFMPSLDTGSDEA